MRFSNADARALHMRTNCKNRAIQMQNRPREIRAGGSIGVHMMQNAPFVKGRLGPRASQFIPNSPVKQSRAAKLPLKDDDATKMMAGRSYACL
ncbi:MULTISPECIES: hypothetical protein [Rhizobium]|uniref:Uncharacterized protein n=1 Tax=Rhizobium paranaense TaxID=1650438 RepID=A0A7W8XW94_9HYPH|nr:MULTISPECIES: hypothetical protein [Rhizobium]MBB5576504.1 hypothetical protein [Rhizobium paranaense]